MNKTRLAALALMLACAAPLNAQGNPAAGKAAFAVCVACHGVDGGGIAELNAPAIAGQEEWYVLRQLQNLRTGIRGGANDMYGAQMAPMAMSLATDTDVANVAAYVASLKPAAVTHTLGGDAAAGKVAFTPCAACHGPAGKGMKEMGAPNITLQQDWYVVRQLTNFKSGIRGAHAGDTYGAQMAPMAQLLADETAMRNVAAHLATLR